VDLHDTGPPPMPPPPLGRMQAPEILSPPLSKMFGEAAFDLPRQPGAGDAYRAARLNKPGQVFQVQLIRTVVRKGVNGHDGVKEIPGERQSPGVGVDREYPCLDASIANALEVLSGAKPQVSCPHLHSELTV